MNDKSQRRLAAILAADVVGYSRLMDAEEARTLAGLRALRQEMLEPCVAEHRGAVVKRMGDGWLVEFASVLDAVNCAVVVQHRLAEHDFIKLRMGIHVGDIVHEGEDIYGTGVNVAARLEAICRPGGICISDRVFHEVKRKLEVAFVDGGTPSLKNIEDPIQVYHLADGADEPTPSSSANAKAETVQTGKPRVAVRDLQAIGVNAELEALAQGLRQGLVDGLAKSTALTVAASEIDGCDFLLTGTARAAGERLRLSFTLTDLESASQIWSERYERRLDDIFDLEDEVAQAVVYAARLRMKAAESQLLRDRENADLSVTDLLTKAAGYLGQWISEGPAALDTLAVALEKAPENTMAHAMTAGALVYMSDFSPIGLSRESRERIELHLGRAVSLRGAGFFEHLIKGIAEADLNLDFAEAKVQFETALQYSPGLMPAEIALVNANCHLGGREDGLQRLRHLVANDRTGPHRFRQARELAVCLAMFGRDAEAAEVMRRIGAQQSDLRRNQLILAATLALAGDIVAAEAAVAALTEDFPDLSI
ncbi:MAG: adenylate/guanylate cyclase domain-containing protein [Alphaproteobacteria bacterium]